MNEKESRLSLEGRTSEERLVTNSGLKIGNKKNVVSNKQEIKERFEEAVDRQQDVQQNSIQKALELGQKFSNLINDKTLSDNKGPMAKSLEKEVLREWQHYILEQNNPPEDDLSTPEGLGSLSGILMIFSALLKLRDRANIAEYKVEQLEQEIKQLRDRANIAEYKVEQLEQLEQEIKQLKQSSLGKSA